MQRSAGLVRVRGADIAGIIVVMTWRGRIEA